LAWWASGNFTKGQNRVTVFLGATSTGVKLKPMVLLPRKTLRGIEVPEDIHVVTGT
jgi:hypothetical protein